MTDRPDISGGWTEKNIMEEVLGLGVIDDKEPGTKPKPNVIEQQEKDSEVIGDWILNGVVEEMSKDPNQDQGKEEESLDQTVNWAEEDDATREKKIRVLTDQVEQRQSQVDSLRTQTNEMKAKIRSSKAEKKRMKEETEMYKVHHHKVRVRDVIEKFVGRGIVLPAQRDGVVKMCENFTPDTFDSWVELTELAEPLIDFSEAGQVETPNQKRTRKEEDAIRKEAEQFGGEDVASVVKKMIDGGE